MTLIIGGAYQGKLEYAIEKASEKITPHSDTNGNHEKKVFKCDVENPEMDISSDIINALHLMILAQMRNGQDSMEYLQGKLPSMKNKIVISDDISCGVVPIDPEMRQWREATGRCLSLLATNADEVIRVFCGIGSKIG